MRLKILSITTNYPNPAEPGLGLFIRSRLAAMAAMTQLVVVAPIALTDYSNPRKRLFHKSAPPGRIDSKVKVFHPGWVFPPGGTPMNVACLFCRLAPLISRQGGRNYFDYLDAHFGYPEGVVAALLAILFRRRFVVTLRGSEAAFAKYRSRRLCMQWALPRAAAVIVVSEPLRELAIQLGVNPARIHIIPNGIDRSIFYPRDREAARARLNLKQDERLIVTAGELIEAKGHQVVIRSTRDLLARGHNVALAIAGRVARGGRPFETELHALVQDLGLGAKVRFLGWLDRHPMAELMSAADVFCLASFAEGWPNVINEALACGAPVVASDVGAVPQMIPNPNYGFVVPAKDQDALTEALDRALLASWDRNSIAQLGASRSWEEVAEEVLRVYRSIGETSEAPLPVKPLSQEREISHVRD